MHASAYDRFREPSLRDEARAFDPANDTRDIIPFDDEYLTVVPGHGRPVQLRCYLNGEFRIDYQGNIIAIRFACAENADAFEDITATGAFELFASSLRVTHAPQIAKAVHELRFEWDGQS